jgi:hypothetical protein
MEGQLDIRVIDRPLENLAIHLEDRGPGWFGLPQRLTDRLPEQIRLHRAVESHKHTELPLHTGVTGFLRKPNV